MVKVAALLSLIALAACTTPAGEFCSISRPIRLSSETVDHLTDAEVRAILAHNRRGEEICRWQP